jgi:hypothetical protein
VGQLLPDDFKFNPHLSGSGFSGASAPALRSVDMKKDAFWIHW